MKPEDGKPLPEFQAGQYISIKVRIPDSEYTHIRQYSLSDMPGKDYYRISVKKDGVVSSYLHDGLQEGDSIEISAPAGDFVLDHASQKDLVLISAGVGITPMISMLKTSVSKQPERQILFIHAAKNSEYHALRHEVEEAAKHSAVKTAFVYREPTEEDRAGDLHFHEGQIDQQFLKELIANTDADYYICGSPSFITAMHKLVSELGSAPESIHYEPIRPAIKFGAVRLNTYMKLFSFQRRVFY